jgi:hypothetical protein
MNLLCRLGFHKMRDLRRGDFNGVTQDVTSKCLRCGREEHVLLINPLSGPRKGPMHPDAQKRTADRERYEKERQQRFAALFEEFDWDLIGPGTLPSSVPPALADLHRRLAAIEKRSLN